MIEGIHPWHCPAHAFGAVCRITENTPGMQIVGGEHDGPFLGT